MTSLIAGSMFLSGQWVIGAVVGILYFIGLRTELAHNIGTCSQCFSEVLAENNSDHVNVRSREGWIWRLIRQRVCWQRLLKHTYTRFKCMMAFNKHGIVPPVFLEIIKHFRNFVLHGFEQKGQSAHQYFKNCFNSSQGHQQRMKEPASLFGHWLVFNLTAEVNGRNSWRIFSGPILDNWRDTYEGAFIMLKL